MKKYNSKITLVKTSRGVWGLDTVKGCKHGVQANKKGCYGACYAYSIAQRYGYDFSKPTLRYFESIYHMKNIISQIKLIDMDFIRIGIMGDPSECWGHTIDICDKIKQAGKKIVIITKHWEKLPSYLYEKVKELGLTINTSVSALDDDLTHYRLNEYNNLKSICKSVLRVVSCDFNINHMMGKIYNDIQEDLFKNENVIDTVLRVSEKHDLVKNGIINISKRKFLSTETTASINNEKSHFGYCINCPEKCGVNF